ncbi:hypothetical protein PATSB16_04290 [Pandoraea thiooxydans]|nr:hypothetical protein PATSB16_04290 [Pandoraea thiooxydans]
MGVAHGGLFAHSHDNLAERAGRGVGRPLPRMAGGGRQPRHSASIARDWQHN